MSLFNVNWVGVIPPLALDNGLFALWFGNVEYIWILVKNIAEHTTLVQVYRIKH